MHPSHPSQWLYFVETLLGHVWIAPDPNGNGRFWLGLGDEGLGSYHKPWQATDDAAHGHSGDARLDQFVGARPRLVPADAKEWNRGRRLAGGTDPS